jgi:hypothetical protein
MLWWEARSYSSTQVENGQNWNGLRGKLPNEGPNPVHK